MDRWEIEVREIALDELAFRFVFTSEQLVAEQLLGDAWNQYAVAVGRYRATLREHGAHRAAMTIE